MKTVYTISSVVKIKNAVGTAGKKCDNCGTWIAHWDRFSPVLADTCSVYGCDEAATVGAHVTRPKAENEAYQTHPYIVPMCASHNGEHGKTFNSKEGVTFVWANVKETCGKLP